MSSDRGSARIFAFLLAALATACAAICSAQPPHSVTLRQTLASSGVSLDPKILKNLDHPIAGSAMLDDDRQLAVAYFLDSDSDGLTPPLYIDRFDRRT